MNRRRVEEKRKTTVIDAIILALYGKIPRYDGGSGPKDFINNDVNECFVKFKFSIRVNKNTDNYKVEVDRLLLFLL